MSPPSERPLEPRPAPPSPAKPSRSLRCSMGGDTGAGAGPISSCGFRHPRRLTCPPSLTCSPARLADLLAAALAPSATLRRLSVSTPCMFVLWKATRRRICRGEGAAAAAHNPNEPATVGCCCDRHAHSPSTAAVPRSGHRCPSPVVKRIRDARRSINSRPALCVCTAAQRPCGRPPGVVEQAHKQPMGGGPHTPGGRGCPASIEREYVRAHCLALHPSRRRKEGAPHDRERSDMALRSCIVCGAVRAGKSTRRERRGDSAGHRHGKGHERIYNELERERGARVGSGTETQREEEKRRRHSSQHEPTSERRPASLSLFDAQLLPTHSAARNDAECCRRGQ